MSERECVRDKVSGNGNVRVSVGESERKSESDIRENEIQRHEARERRDKEHIQ